MDQWNLGIFPMMGIMVGLIIGILAIRFAYIDKRYSAILKDYNTTAASIEQDINKETTSDEDQQLLSYQLSSYSKIIGGYENGQENNRTMGAIIDIVAICFIILCGLLATLGLFADNILLLIISLVFMSFLPVLHFVLHIRKLQWET